MSRKRLISTMSFQAGRTTADAVPACAACSCARTSGTSLGECSVSSRSQSKPECETISAVIGLHRLHYSPICSSPFAMACLNTLRGRSMAGSSDELHGDAAERAEIGMQRVALAGEHHASERARKHEMAGLDRD